MATSNGAPVMAALTADNKDQLQMMKFDSADVQLAGNVGDLITLYARQIDTATTSFNTLEQTIATSHRCSIDKAVTDRVVSRSHEGLRRVLLIHHNLHMPLACQLIREVYFFLKQDLKEIEAGSLEEGFDPDFKEKVRQLKHQAKFVEKMYNELRQSTLAVNHTGNSAKATAQDDARQRQKDAADSRDQAMRAEDKANRHWWLSLAFSVPTLGLSLLGLKLDCERYMKDKATYIEQADDSSRMASYLQGALDWLSDLEVPMKTVTEAMRAAVTYFTKLTSDVDSIDGMLSRRVLSPKAAKFVFTELQKPAERLARACESALTQLPVIQTRLEGAWQGEERAETCVAEWLAYDRLSLLRLDDYGNPLKVWHHIYTTAMLSIQPKDFSVVRYCFDNRRGLNMALNIKFSDVSARARRSERRLVIMKDEETRTALGASLGANILGAEIMLNPSVDQRDRNYRREETSAAQADALQTAAENVITWSIPAGRECGYLFLVRDGNVEDVLAV